MSQQFAKLIPELIHEIARHLGCRDVISFTAVCKPCHLQRRKIMQQKINAIKRNIERFPAKYRPIFKKLMRVHTLAEIQMSALRPGDCINVYCEKSANNSLEYMIVVDAIMEGTSADDRNIATQLMHYPEMGISEAIMVHVFDPVTGNFMFGLKCLVGLRCAGPVCKIIGTNSDPIVKITV